MKLNFWIIILYVILIEGVKNITIWPQEDPINVNNLVVKAAGIGFLDSWHTKCIFSAVQKQKCPKTSLNSVIHITFLFQTVENEQKFVTIKMEVDSGEVERSDIDADSEVIFWINLYYFLQNVKTGWRCNEKWP